MLSANLIAGGGRALQWRRRRQQLEHLQELLFFQAQLLTHPTGLPKERGGPSLAAANAAHEGGDEGVLQYSQGHFEGLRFPEGGPRVGAGSRRVGLSRE